MFVAYESAHHSFGKTGCILHPDRLYSIRHCRKNWKMKLVLVVEETNRWDIDVPNDCAMTSGTSEPAARALPISFKTGEFSML